MIASVATVALAQKPHPHAMTGMKPAPMKNMSKSDWQNMYNQAETLFAKKNAEGVMKYMAPDFTMTMMGKTQTRDEALASLKQWFSMMKTLHASMQVVKVVHKGNTDIVTDKFRMTGTMMMGPKKTGKYVDTGTETCTWTKMGNHWMMQKMVSVGEKMTMDGKPFDPNKMGGGGG